ncbi:MAG: lysophospholipid acyltransferase family protein [bacterium]
MKLSHLFEYLFFQCCSFCIQILPFSSIQKLGSAAGVMVFSLLGYRREVTLTNIRKAFPEKNKIEVQQLARGAFRNIGIAFFELLALNKLTEDDIRSMVHFENPEVLTEAHQRGQGLLILTAHFGSWEILAQALNVNLQLTLKGIVKVQSNRLIDRKVNELRTRFGNSVVSMEESVREVLRTLRSGGVVGIVADQAAPKENIPVMFFGRAVPTHLGPAIFCLKTRAPLVAVFIYRQSDGTYKVLSEEVPIDDLREYSEENVVELTKRHVALTEFYIRRQPDHWMWMHKRWKHVDAQPGTIA